MWRWAWRMLGRERAATVLVVALVGLPVAFTVFAVAAVSSTAAIPEAELGAASHRVSFTSPDGPAAARTARKEMAERFEQSVLVDTGGVTVNGRAGVVDLVALDATEPLAKGLVRLLEGRMPTAADEVAIHPELGRLAHLDIGGTLRTEDGERTVVGVVENPNAFDEPLALVTAGSITEPDLIGLLVAADDAAITEALRTRQSGVTSALIDRRSINDATLAALAVSAFGALALAEVALVAAAAFAVSNRRRQHDLALLGAAGATPAQLRHAVLATAGGGGILGALTGTLIGLGAALAATGWFEQLGHRRLDGPALPWRFIAAIAAAAVLATIAAGWWPARTVARQALTAALAAHRPPAQGIGRTATVGAVLATSGTAASVAAYKAQIDILTGLTTAAATIGIVLLAPAAVTALGRMAGQLPLPARLAARDLARNRTRSAAGVAALVVAFGFPLTVAAATTSFDDHARATYTPNLPPNQALVLPDSFGAFAPRGLDLTRSDLGRRLARGLPETRVAPLTVPVLPDNSTSPGLPGQMVGRVLIALPHRSAPPTMLDRRLTIATGELLAALDNPTLTAAIAEHPLVTTDPNLPAGVEAQLLGPANINVGESAPDVPPVAATPVTIYRLAEHAYTVSPTTFVREDLVRDTGWETTTLGWIVVSDRALTEPEHDTAARLAADEGLQLVSTDAPAQTTTTRRVVLAIGAANALAVLAAIVALTRTEARRDDALLTAIGAAPHTRRSLAASTALLTSIAAVLLALPAAAIPLAGLFSRPEYQWVAPVEALVVVGAAIPVLAAIGSWLTARSGP